MFGSLVSMFAQPTIQAMAAGLLTGVVAGTALVGAGLVPLGKPPSAPTAALLACPGGGPILARVPTGQALLVTARSEDGAWLEVYVGVPGADRAWAPAPQLTLQAPLDSLPVGRCETPVATIPPTPVPSVAPSQAAIATVGPTATASPAPEQTEMPTLKPTRTPKPTPIPTTTFTVLPPPPPPSPSPTPVNHPPSASSLATNANCIDNGSTYTQAVITVSATDPDPGDSLTVRLRLGRIYQGNQYYRLGSFTMTPIGGGQYSYTITQAALVSYSWSSATADSEITYDVTAYDLAGVASTTLKSHDSVATQLFYRSYSGCIIF